MRVKRPYRRSTRESALTESRPRATFRWSATAPTGPASSLSTGPARSTTAGSFSHNWQQTIVDSHPWEFIRGLVHSDGCRITNWTEKVIAGERKRYEYPRYFFTNLSADIRRLYTDTLDKVGVAWKQPNAKNISVARKASVALMDAHVGPKH